MPNPYLSALNSLDTSPLGVPGAGVGTWEDGPWLRRRQGLFGCHQSQSRPSRCPLTRLQLISNETSGAKKELRKVPGTPNGWNWNRLNDERAEASTCLWVCGGVQGQKPNVLHPCLAFLELHPAHCRSRCAGSVYCLPAPERSEQSRCGNPQYFPNLI